MSHRLPSPLILALLTWSGCATSIPTSTGRSPERTLRAPGAPSEERASSGTTTQSRSHAVGSLRIQPSEDAARQGVRPGDPAGLRPEELDPAALFERGSQLLSARKHREALESYDVLLQRFGSSKLVSPTLYNAGLAHEWLGEFDKAVLRYRELIRLFGSTQEAIDASFRLGGCYAELRNWPASAQVFAELLRRKDLSASDRIEALARKGLAHFRLGDARSCQSTLEEAVAFHQRVENVERIETDFFLAMAQYYQAALPHLDFRNLRVDAGAELARTLDEKARLLIAAQTKYIDAIKVKNPYWATAAGFQVGSLYREFYTVLLTTVPDFRSKAAANARLAKISADAAERQLIQVYLEEVHRAVKPLLSKAIRVFEKNVLVADTVGMRSDWVSKSRRQVEELKHLLSLPPAEAVKLVRSSADLVPEDQPASPELSPPPGSPDAAPARPSDKPPPEPEDEPGRVLL